MYNIEDTLDAYLKIRERLKLAKREGETVFFLCCIANEIDNDNQMELSYIRDIFRYDLDRLPMDFVNPDNIKHEHMRESMFFTYWDSNVYSLRLNFLNRRIAQLRRLIKKQSNDTTRESS